MGERVFILISPFRQGSPTPKNKDMPSKINQNGETETRGMEGPRGMTSISRENLDFRHIFKNTPKKKPQLAGRQGVTRSSVLHTAWKRAREWKVW